MNLFYDMYSDIESSNSHSLYSIRHRVLYRVPKGTKYQLSAVIS